MCTQLPLDEPIRAPTLTVVASQPPRRADHRSYAWAAAAFAIVTLFYRSTGRSVPPVYVAIVP